MYCGSGTVNKVARGQPADAVGARQTLQQ